MPSVSMRILPIGTRILSVSMGILPIGTRILSVSMDTYPDTYGTYPN
jgi:hypothetical protein